MRDPLRPLQGTEVVRFRPRGLIPLLEESPISETNPEVPVIPPCAGAVPKPSEIQHAEPRAGVRPLEPEEEDGPSLEWSEEFQRLRRFFRTRSAIIGGEPLYDWSHDELEKKGYLTAWKFNVAESALASVPVAVAGQVVSFLLPQPDLPRPEVIATRLQSVINPLVIPFLLFFAAGWVARSSFKKKDATAAGMRRSKKAYLYLEGSHGFLPELVASAAAVVLSFTSFTLGKGAPEPAPVVVIVTILAVVAGLVAVIWLSRVVRVRIPKKLFLLNGYSARRLPFYKLWTKDPAVGPWNRYTMTVGFLVPIFIGASLSALALVIRAVASLVCKQ